MNKIEEKLLEYVNLKLTLASKYCQYNSNKRLLTFGEPVLSIEMEYINKILNRFPDAVISIPVDNPIISFKDTATLDEDGKLKLDRADLIDCTKWSGTMREKLKPAIIDIFALQKVWEDPWVKREEMNQIAIKIAGVSSWLKVQTMSTEMTVEDKTLYNAICLADKLESLNKIKKKLEKIA